MKELIMSNNDVLTMLDGLLQEQRSFDWDGFYADRNKKVPFFVDLPDENLVKYIEKGILPGGKALELGCGPGRNAIYLAEKGFLVDAVDSSEEGLNWAAERAKEKGVAINFRREDLFDMDYKEQDYDFVYDSGCFHHIAPHRRMDYIELVEKALKPGGYFALSTFIEGGPLGGADISDWDVYRLKSMRGGLGYSEKKLKTIFQTFAPVEIRFMEDRPNSKSVFGLAGLRVALFKKKR
ncbi:class I SAM-dependent methyltransferase [Bacillus sp. SG-1]|uniref:class I SAM-dependent methyltransferase n=1 Tax=Bacillus sp. SG-1 TaxID=161544 RepID=UPI00031559C2|nr:class I SAM-dependent methyltransferase [Bacillus sp. SG-1]